jgi:hypothetical protein
MKKLSVWGCIAAWIALAILTAYYSWTTPDKVTINEVDVSSEMAIGRLQVFLWIGIGGAFALISLAVRRWYFPIPLSALVYLVVWYLTGTLPTAGLVEGYKLKWLTASMFGYLPFVIRDVLLPLVFGFAFVASILAALGYPARAVRQLDSEDMRGS